MLVGALPQAPIERDAPGAGAWCWILVQPWHVPAFQYGCPSGWAFLAGGGGLWPSRLSLCQLTGCSVHASGHRHLLTGAGLRLPLRSGSQCTPERADSSLGTCCCALCVGCSWMNSWEQAGPGEQDGARQGGCAPLLPYIPGMDLGDPCPPWTRPGTSQLVGQGWGGPGELGCGAAQGGDAPSRIAGGPSAALTPHQEQQEQSEGCPNPA